MLVNFNFLFKKINLNKTNFIKLNILNLAIFKKTISNKCYQHLNLTECHF